MRKLKRTQWLRFLYFGFSALRFGNRNLGLYVPMPPQRRQVLRPAWRLLSDDPAPWEPLAEIASRDDLTTSEKVFWAYIKRADMACEQEWRIHEHLGLKVHLPYCDEDLVALSLSVPRAMHFRGLKMKSVQHSYLERFLPASYLEQPKLGFPTPVFAWNRADRFREMRAFWHTPASPAFRDVFDTEVIERQVDRLARMRFDSLISYELSTQLYALRSLRLWFDEFEDSLG
jgi:asparagine synthetase B (glutamine-hydrolysing)